MKQNKASDWSTSKAFCHKPNMCLLNLFSMYLHSTRGLGEASRSKILQNFRSANFTELHSRIFQLFRAVCLAKVSKSRTSLTFSKPDVSFPLVCRAGKKATFCLRNGGCFSRSGGFSPSLLLPMSFSLNDE